MDNLTGLGYQAKHLFLKAQAHSLEHLGCNWFQLQQISHCIKACLGSNGIFTSAMQLNNPGTNTISCYFMPRRSTGITGCQQTILPCSAFHSLTNIICQYWFLNFHT